MIFRDEDVDGRERVMTDEEEEMADHYGTLG